MSVLLVISLTCELDPTTSARVRRCSSLVHSLVPWAGLKIVSFATSYTAPSAIQLDSFGAQTRTQAGGNYSGLLFT